jgi:hypothetical protein
MNHENFFSYFFAIFTVWHPQIVWKSPSTVNGILCKRNFHPSGWSCWRDNEKNVFALLCKWRISSGTIIMRGRSLQHSHTQAIIFASCPLHHKSRDSTEPTFTNELHHQASELINTTFVNRFVNWKNEKMEKLWKINCAISLECRWLTWRLGMDHLMALLAQIFMLDALASGKWERKRGKLWDGTRWCGSQSQSDDFPWRENRFSVRKWVNERDWKVFKTLKICNWITRLKMFLWGWFDVE